ncbi:hypothetical protein BN2475_490032 [Paraburkholderia ribeironis]|uniref:Uncharacterized protein n=1 Tax=Paraburkholderia ribeironis TaxID=1247936 RepID=A0A1N7SBJ4_9BURK|nr:hypothetical protein BN2475_490032 [Paraburkholderia ribeironis]
MGQIVNYCQCKFKVHFLSFSEEAYVAFIDKWWEFSTLFELSRRSNVRLKARSNDRRWPNLNDRSASRIFPFP